MNIVRTTVVVALFAALLFPRPAVAQQSASDAMVEQGIALRNRGQSQAAITHLQQVWRTTRNPRALAQLAATEQSMGRWADAEEHFVELLAHREMPWVQANRARVERSLDVVRRRVADDLSATPEAEVANPAPRAEVAPDGVRSGGVQRALGWVSAGLAVAGLGVGITGSVLSANFRDGFGNTCDDVHRCSDADLNTMLRHEDLKVVGFVAAGTFALGAVALLLTAPSRSASTRGLRVAVTSAGVGALWRW